MGFGRGVLVVIAQYHWNCHPPDEIEAFLGIGPVANDVTQAGDVEANLNPEIFQHRVQGLQIGVSFGEDGVSHQACRLGS